MAQCPVSWDYTAFKFALHESKLASGAWNSNNKPLESGDVISVDCGFQNGYHGDHAYSFEIGEVAPKQKTITSY
jgi:methionine aminopeptidase